MGRLRGGSDPGLSLDTARWIFDHELGGGRDRHLGAEVLPNETDDVFQPLHIVLIVHMGLMVGEIFELEAGRRLRDDGVYEFMFAAAAADHRRRRLADQPAWRSSDRLQGGRR